jgi:hypothetical protein
MASKKSVLGAVNIIFYPVVPSIIILASPGAQFIPSGTGKDLEVYPAIFFSGFTANTPLPVGVCNTTLAQGPLILSPSLANYHRKEGLLLSKFHPKFSQSGVTLNIYLYYPLFLYYAKSSKAYYSFSDNAFLSCLFKPNFSASLILEGFLSKNFKEVEGSCIFSLIGISLNSPEISSNSIAVLGLISM